MDSGKFGIFFSERNSSFDRVLRDHRIQMKSIEEEEKSFEAFEIFSFKSTHEFVGPI
jgi:hypothetical protein